MALECWRHSEHILGWCCMIWSASTEYAGTGLQVSAAWWCRYFLLGSAGVCCLAVQVSASWWWRNRSAAWWCWSRCCCFVASLAGCCIVVTLYLQRGVVRRSEVILRRLSEIVLKKLVYDFQKLALKRAVWESFGNWLESGIDCAESAAVIGWIPCRLLVAGL